MSRASANCAADQEQHDGAGPGRRHRGQLVEVFRPARRHRIRELGEARAPHQVHVLDLDVAGRTIGRFQQEVDARVAAVLHLAPGRRVAGKLGDGARRDRLGHEQVGVRGVDTDQLGAAAEIDLDQLPAIGELAVRIAGLGQPHARAWRREPGHRPRIGDVSGDRLARGQHHVGEEALVALDEGGGDERLFEEH
jgi:hypothetical protein